MILELNHVNTILKVRETRHLTAVSRLPEPISVVSLAGNKPDKELPSGTTQAFRVGLSGPLGEQAENLQEILTLTGAGQRLLRFGKQRQQREHK